MSEKLTNFRRVLFSSLRSWPVLGIFLLTIFLCLNFPHLSLWLTLAGFGLVSANSFRLLTNSDFIRHNLDQPKVSLETVLNQNITLLGDRLRQSGGEEMKLNLQKARQSLQKMQKAWPLLAKDEQERLQFLGATISDLSQKILNLSSSERQINQTLAAEKLALDRGENQEGNLLENGENEEDSAVEELVSEGKKERQEIIQSWQEKLRELNIYAKKIAQELDTSSLYLSQISLRQQDFGHLETVSLSENLQTIAKEVELFEQEMRQNG